MARGFLDDDDLRAITGQKLDGIQSFDVVEKSQEFIERAKNVMSEITLLQEDLKEIWAEAREWGLEVDVLKLVIRRSRKSKAEVEAMDHAVQTIEMALDGTPAYDDDGERHGYDREDEDDEEPEDRQTSPFDIL